MATKKPNPAMDHIVASLKRNPQATYGDIKARADAKSLTVYPIMFGRAQAMLGIVKSAPRGTAKVAKARAVAGKRGKRASAPPPPPEMKSLDDVFAFAKANEASIAQERDALRAALQQIHETSGALLAQLNGTDLFD